MTTEFLKSNSVRVNRLQLGLSQSELAERAGISRTAVTAIEGSRLVPSVAAALAISSVLGKSVESLFGNAAASSEMEVWASQPVSKNMACWRAEVSGRTVLFPASSSPMFTPLPDQLPTDALVGPANLTTETLVIACCDPAAGLLASCFHEITGLRLLVLPRSSAQAVEMLKAGLVHLAGVHFSTDDEPDRNAEYVQSKLGNGYRMIRVAKWQEGIALRSESGYRSVRTVSRAKLKWIGRETGSGARQCLDRILGNRTSPRSTASNHRGVAESIRSGNTDAGVCVQLASAEAGLDFLPVQTEAYDLCFSSSITGDRRLKGLLATLRSKGYRRLLSNLLGYDSSESGDFQTA